MLSELHGAQGDRCKAVEKSDSGRRSRTGLCCAGRRKTSRWTDLELCSEHGMEVTEVTTMTELGDAVGIDVGAAVVVVLH